MTGGKTEPAKAARLGKMVTATEPSETVSSWNPIIGPTTVQVARCLIAGQLPVPYNLDNGEGSIPLLSWQP